MTTTQRVDKLSPLEKFHVLANDIDQLRNRVTQLGGQQSIDELIEVLDLSDLGEQFGVSLNVIRKKIQQSGGQVFKVGKRYVIRKVKFLEVLEKLEQG